jgi:molybdate transport system substrate-binding protein
MLLGRCLEGPKEPDIGAEDFLQHLEMDAVIALRPLADREKRHVVETKLMERLGIADEMKSRTKLVDGVPVAELVAKGEAEIGMQQINVILPIAGIDYVGPLPPELQDYVVFSASVLAVSKQPEAATAMVKFMSAPEAAPLIRKSGMEPAVR